VEELFAVRAAFVAEALWSRTSAISQLRASTGMRAVLPTAYVMTTEQTMHARR
jgi:hypothetical protein